ncbi:hypothetical protein PV04_08908 [Phialophora macrospora]|uniref:Heterokaryon incompatibility domain-containing protein n=1 Tax=Phialophora macrospora TaxID=1851006 RepID=A0A0D2CFN7_9EURO|nr:hypothetical protein PV04_08908 [Phialophora macrospora]
MLCWKRKEKKAAAAFVYENLTDQYDFRLLELLPGTEFEPIRCRLRLARLAAQPLYNAVSYTWGEPPADKTILVNDLKFRVRPNLHDMLAELRHTHHHQTYWIDAICINQQDNEERSIQVRKMASIFQTAVGVVAWLRDHTITEPDRYNTVTVKRVSDALQFQLSMFQPPSRPDLVVILSTLSIIAAFFNHEYWRRRWIIQELVLARSVQICSNNFSVPLTHVKTLVQLHASLVTGGGQRLLRHQYESFDNSLAARICNLQGDPYGPNSDLEWLLRNYASTECAEPLDKVYALLSMSGLGSERFLVSYDVSKLDLLLGTVEFSSAQQSLDPSKAISFALMLRKQLGIKVEELDPGAGAGFKLFQPPSIAGTRDTRSVLYKRGIVTSSRVDDATLFRSMHALREQCEGLTHFDIPFGIETTSPPSWSEYTHLSRDDLSTSPDYTWRPYDTWTVSPRDLFAFVWQPSDLYDRESSSPAVWLGFASSRTEAGDLVYQFPGTSVAILLRKVAGSLRLQILGRARLARLTAREALMLPVPSDGRLQAGDENLGIVSKGWRTLDLIKLATAEL